MFLGKMKKLSLSGAIVHKCSGVTCSYSARWKSYIKHYNNSINYSSSQRFRIKKSMVIIYEQNPGGRNNYITMFYNEFIKNLCDGRYFFDFDYNYYFSLWWKFNVNQKNNDLICF